MKQKVADWLALGAMALTAGAALFLMTSLVTAAVTPTHVPQTKTVIEKAQAQPQTRWHVFLTDASTGEQAVYNRKTFASRQECDRAIEGLQNTVDDLSAVIIPENVRLPAWGADREVVASLVNVVMLVRKEFGAPLHLLVTCEGPERPA